MQSTKRHLAIASIALAAVVALSACGGDESGSSGSMDGMNHGMSSSSSEPGTSPAGQARDVMFAQMMIPHHQQAVEMADLALQKRTSSAVAELAEQIRTAQGPEIDTMNEWLREWNAPMASGSHGGHSDGMMTDADMKQLTAAQGDAFDRMWLTMMIEHHEGAIVMARDVLKTTKNPNVKSMAQNIISGQTKEIATMRELL